MSDNDENDTLGDLGELLELITELQGRPSPSVGATDYDASNSIGCQLYDKIFEKIPPDISLDVLSKLIALVMAENVKDGHESLLLFEVIKNLTDNYKRAYVMVRQEKDGDSDEQSHTEDCQHGTDTHLMAEIILEPARVAPVRSIIATPSGIKIFYAYPDGRFLCSMDIMCMDQMAVAELLADAAGALRQSIVRAPAAMADQFKG